MSLIRFGVAKLRAAAKAMLKQYDGACPRSGYLVSHYKAFPVLGRNKITILLAIRHAINIWSISSRAPWLLSVTEGLALPPKSRGGYMPNSRFDLREWLVPPVLMPIFLVLLVAAAMFIQW
jgi:hypothetical protein